MSLGKFKHFFNISITQAGLSIEMKRKRCKLIINNSIFNQQTFNISKDQSVFHDALYLEIHIFL